MDLHAYIQKLNMDTTLYLGGSLVILMSVFWFVVWKAAVGGDGCFRA